MLRRLITLLQRLRLSIRYKIGLAFGLLLLGFIGNGLVSALLLLNIQQTQLKLTTTAVDLEQLQRYELAYNTQLDLYGDAIFLVKSTFFRDNFGNIIIYNQLNKLDTSSTLFNTEFKTRFGKVYSTAYDDFGKLQTLIRAGEFDQAKEKWREYSPEFDKVSSLISERTRQLKLERDTNSAQLEATIQLSLLILAVVAGLSIIFTLILLFLVGRVLIIPLKNLNSSLRRVAEGDLEQDLAIINRDEIGELKESFSRAILVLKEVINGVRISEQLRGVTRLLAQSSQSQTEGSQNQVTAIVEAIKVLEELQNMSGQIAEGSGVVVSLTENTLSRIEEVALAGYNSQNCADQMVVVVENTINGVNRVSQQVSSFTGVIEEVAAKSRSINGVVATLNNIAGEVHLLALNASIEAVGAGQYGERFKVIARQIKELANWASQATGQAGQLITEVQTGIELAVAEVGKGQTEVSKVVEDNTRIGASLQELQASALSLRSSVSSLQTLAGQVNEQAEQIKQATNHQRYSYQHIIDTVYSIQAIAEQTADGSREIATSTGELDTMARRLNLVLANIK